MALPETQQVVEVVEQTAGVLLSILLLPQGIEIEGQFGLPPGQHQDDQAGVQTAHILLFQKGIERNRTYSFGVTVAVNELMS